LPPWRHRSFVDIRRGAVNALLDDIVDAGVKTGRKQRFLGGGAKTADYVLKMLSSIFNWYAIRNEDYSSPIIAGMKRCETKVSRERILTDEEICRLWGVCEQEKSTSNSNAQAAAIMQLCLLTAQRVGKVLGMRWCDLDDDIWRVPTLNPREKGVGGNLRLPEMATDMVQERLGDNPYVFPTDRRNGRSRIGRPAGTSGPASRPFVGSRPRGPSMIFAARRDR
jgi:integrase